MQMRTLRTRRSVVVAGASILIGGVVTRAFAQNDATPGASPDASPMSSPDASPMAADGIQVSIHDFTFDAPTVEVPAGGTVTWTNNDLSGHSVVADDGSFASPTLGQGDTFSYTFETAGDVPYHCGLHVNMKGIVTVV